MSTNARAVRVYLADPNFDRESCALKFSLTYEGRLYTNFASRYSDRPSKAEFKDFMRSIFHCQLKRLWKTNQFLSSWSIFTGQYEALDAKQWILSRVNQPPGFQFLPLVNKDLCVECGIDIRLLRPTDFNGNVSDLDNQIKILLDSLQKPQHGSDIGDIKPDPEKTPYYVLVDDDRLITKISATCDELLYPICGKSDIEGNDVRILIDVYIRPLLPNENNVIFFSEDRGVWDHKYDEAIPENLSTLTSNQLRSLATQCVFRIKALAKHVNAISMARSLPNFEEDFDTRTKRASNEFHEIGEIWRSDLHPKAVAIKRELLKRIYGEPPYPDDRTIESSAIDFGSLAGVDPLGNAAIYLERLIRSLS